MLAALVVVLRSLALICCGHRAVALENPCAPPAVGGVQAHGPATPTPPSRSTVLGATRPCLEGLAHGADRSEAGHRRTLASEMAPPPVDSTLYAYWSWPAQYECRHSEARKANGRR
jgi:hypothetical protein